VTALTLRNEAITAALIVVLDDEAPLPVSTPQLVARLGMAGEWATVLRMLNRLARLGEVEKWPADGEERCCYWRRLSGLQP
jgi:hypothetical protein